MHRSCGNKYFMIRYFFEFIKILSIKIYWVGERSVSLRRCVVKHAGGIRSANADISNDKAGEKPARRKTKGSCPTLIGAG